MSIRWWHPVVGEEELARVAEVMASGFPNDGEVTDAFAARIAEIAGVAYGVGVSSGSAALYCALAACGVGPGDEVIVPDLTFIATANAVRLTGADVVLADVRHEDFGLEPEAVRNAITPRTKAIMPVHVNGRGGALEEIVSIAREHGLRVVEDASEALTSRLAGRPLGSFGDAAAFSFAPTKIITTGQGGVAVTDDPQLEQRLRELKDQGRATRGSGGADAHPVFGFNFKLTNVHAAIGMAQLNRLPERLLHIENLHEWYAEELAGLEPTIRLLPIDRAAGEALSWIDAIVERRGALVSHLAERGIDSREFWFPLHTQAPYAASGFPGATWASGHGLWLPSALSLRRGDISDVGRAIREFAAAPALA
jgi:perosamine synthetase